MDSKYANNYRAWIRDVLDEFGGKFPRNWPDSMVILPYWQQGYSPHEFVQVYHITFKEGADE